MKIIFEIFLTSDTIYFYRFVQAQYETDMDCHVKFLKSHGQSVYTSRSDLRGDVMFESNGEGREKELKRIP